MSTVLAFDIGIKNLAYCVLRSADAASAGAGASASSASAVLALENCNLMESSAEASRICSKCRSKATFVSGVGDTAEATCKRHIPNPFTPLSVNEKGTPGEATEETKSKICTRIPAVAVLRTLARSAGLAAPSAAKRDDLLATLATRFALPLVAPKAPRAADQGLEQIHDALRRFVADRWVTFRQCTAVLLENQPAFKNPHMKSVQVLLFAVLRERFLQEQERGLGCGETVPLPTFHLVHAKKKVTGEGIAKGDAGYKARKDGSEKRLEELFATGTVTSAVPGADHLAAWVAAKKKSDMADALCMCVDFLAPGKKA
jgi:hypothetical protein